MEDHGVLLYSAPRPVSKWNEKSRKVFRSFAGLNGVVYCILVYYKQSQGAENELQVPSPQLAIHFAAARKPPLCSAVRSDTNGQYFNSHSTAFSIIDLATFF